MTANFQITDSTPVAMLTVGQQKELFQKWVKEIVGAVNASVSDEKPEKRYVYGLAGISSLFNVSHATAFKLKCGVLAPAILQQGRKILVDADMAIELFRQHSGK